MIGGAAEPLYVPAAANQKAQLFYRENFAASALHEAAHWCIAGANRRTREDFGYIYVPPPRSVTQQEKFFASELRTQSLESLFAEQAGVKFIPSADNLLVGTCEFSFQLSAQREITFDWVMHTVDTRAKRFFQALGRTG